MLKQTLLTCCLALVIMIGYGQKSKTKTPVSWESVVVQEKMKVGGTDEEKSSSGSVGSDAA